MAVAAGEGCGGSAYLRGQYLCLRRNILSVQLPQSPAFDVKDRPAQQSLGFGRCHPDGVVSAVVHLSACHEQRFWQPADHRRGLGDDSRGIRGHLLGDRM